RFLDKHLSVGISGKYLMGFADISTSRKNREISIYTNPDIYQLEMTTNYQLNSSAKGSLISQLPFSNDSLPIHNTGKNNGFALDIGAEYIINDKISVAASVIDIGSITWRENINSYKSEGKYTYQGVDVASLVLQDSSIGFDAITDTLKKSFNFERIENKSYKTPLNTQFYLSTTYRPIPILRVGGLFYGTFLYGKLQPSIAISGNIDLKKWFSVGIVAAYRNRHLMPPGINISLGGGPVQVFFATDNIVGAVMPLGTKDSNMRFGFNWLLGYKDNSTDVEL
ncbi:MAG: DUF5723 family protein, partial [Bacteroidales bacterium]